MLAITYHTYGEGCVVVNRIDIEGTEPQSYQELGTCWILEGADTKRMCISHIEGEVYKTPAIQQYNCTMWKLTKQYKAYRLVCTSPDTMALYVSL